MLDRTGARARLDHLRTVIVDAFMAGDGARHHAACVEATAILRSMGIMSAGDNYTAGHMLDRRKCNGHYAAKLGTGAGAAGPGAAAGHHQHGGE